MQTTSPTLLDRLRDVANQDAWRRFVQLYTPMMYRWASRTGLEPNDANDLVQDVFAVLVRALPEFRYDQQQSFRAWLRTVLLNKWRENARRRMPVSLDPQEGVLAELVGRQDVDFLSEADYRQQLVRRGMELIRGDFQEATWRAWCEFVIVGRSAAEVAREVGISVHAVYLAKSRVLRRLRQELEGLMD
jgi:RNA polymerase sigma-70 factor (ECF subfamily)